MGKAARRKRPTAREKREIGKLDEHVQRGRYVPYTSLLATGRAVRYRRDHDVSLWWVELQQAGEQGTESGGPTANRSYAAAFATEVEAKRSGESFLAYLKAEHCSGKINTDTRYNQYLRAWSELAERKIARELEEATEDVRRAPHAPTLLQLLKQRVIGAVLAEKETSNGE